MSKSLEIAIGSTAMYKVKNVLYFRRDVFILHVIYVSIRHIHILAKAIRNITFQMVRSMNRSTNSNRI